VEDRTKGVTTSFIKDLVVGAVKVNSGDRLNELIHRKDSQGSNGTLVIVLWSVSYWCLRENLVELGESVCSSSTRGN
jgi:hypothetical protein